LSTLSIFPKADWGSYVDTSQQMCVFYIDDYSPVYLAEQPADWSTADYYTKNNTDGTYTKSTGDYSATTQYYAKVS
jgi:hypothetical protein